MLHELATNAVKYGALSRPNGRVSLTWELSDTDLVLIWQERGGPPPTAPTHRGYGTRVINGSIEGQLGGKAAFAWERKGLRCTIVLPRTTNLLAGLPASVGRAESRGDLPALPHAIDGRRILLVEDEALVGMLMKEMLTELDFEVVGPFANIADAESVLLTDGIAAALLDVNVGGQPIYPFAASVAERRVPVIFVTGYTAEAIDERFADAPVLQKPIDREALRRVLSVTFSTRTAAA